MLPGPDADVVAVDDPDPAIVKEGAALLLAFVVLEEMAAEMVSDSSQSTNAW